MVRLHIRIYKYISKASWGHAHQGAPTKRHETVQLRVKTIFYRCSYNIKNISFFAYISSFSNKCYVSTHKARLEISVETLFFSKARRFLLSKIHVEIVML